MQKFGIFGILEYLESFNNCIPTHIQNPVIFTKMGKLCVTLEIQNPRNTDNPGVFKALVHLKPNTYSEPSQRFKMECFAKIVKSYNYF